MKIDFQPYTTEYKDFTVREVYDALKQNGFELIREKWTDVDGSGKIVAGCVLAQTGLNLGVVMNSDDVLNEVEYWYHDQATKLQQKQDNDENNPSNVDYYTEAEIAAEERASHVGDYSLDTQLNRFSVDSSSKWFRTGDSKAANTIIYWNDESRVVNGKKQYYLPTYEDVADMAYDILSPHFDETVTLAVKKYEFIKKEAVLA